MKNLILVRHAKSSWNDSLCPDHDRPLNERGLRVAPLMGQALREKGYQPDLMVSSTAKRAVHTAEIFAEQLGFNTDEIHHDLNLYHSSIAFTVDTIKRLADQVNTAVFFGHNPTWTYLANQLAPFHQHNLPTCGVAIIKFNLDSWSQIKPLSGIAEELLLPQHYDPEHKQSAA